MAHWPRIAALAILLLAMGLLIFFQWLPALLLLPGTGALMVWNQQLLKPAPRPNAGMPQHH